MTRVTPSMLSARYITNSRRNLTNMQRLQNQLSTGKEISRPSDNPYKVSRTMQLYSEIDANKQFKENIKDMSNWLDATDTALDQANNVLARVRELQVKAGNGTFDAGEHLALQVEIKEKINQLGDILNSNFDGAYIFGGSKSTSKPVGIDGNGQIQYTDKNGALLLPIKDSTTGNTLESMIKDDRSGVVTVKYTDASVNPPVEKTSSINVTPTGASTEEQLLRNGLAALKEQAPGHTSHDVFSAATVTKAGDAYTIIKGQIDDQLNVEVSQGVFINYNRTAVDILEYRDSSNTMRNLSDLLNDIVYNLNDPKAKNSGGGLLYTNPVPDVSKVRGELLTQMDSAIANLLQRRSEVGSMSNRMSNAEANNDQQNESMTDILSKTEDIDFAEKMMDYSTMQTVYTASLQVSAKILPMTIMNYL